MKFTAQQRTTCLLAFLLVASGMAAGLTLPIPRPSWQPRPASSISYDLHDLWVIASRNLRIGLQLALGSVSLGAYSLIQLLSLGFSLGVVIRSALNAGVTPIKITLLLAPHSLLEFAGFIALGAIGFEAAALVYRKLRYDQAPVDQSYFRRLAQQALIGFALIAVAALIEVYVTGPIAKHLA